MSDLHGRSCRDLQAAQFSFVMQMIGAPRRRGKEALMGT
jgi:hypothetical protein